MGKDDDNNDRTWDHCDTIDWTDLASNLAAEESAKNARDDDAASIR